MDLDSILNWAMPTAIFMFGAFYFYKLLQEPIDKFAGFIKGLFSKGQDRAEQYMPGGEAGYYYPKNV